MSEDFRAGIDLARYVIALALVATLPPALLFWLIVHPLVRFWRRLGPGWTYTLLIPPLIGLALWIASFRERLLLVEYGFNAWTTGIGAMLFAGGATLWHRHRRQLTLRTLIGLPELSGEPGRLLTEGIYARIRHPRYLEVALGVSAWALFSNYHALYTWALLALPVLWLIVVLEERELKQRFGAAYEDYARRVPRFWPARR